MNKLQERIAGALACAALLLGGCAMQVDEPQPSPTPPAATTPVQRCVGQSGAPCSTRWLGGVQVQPTQAGASEPTNPDPVPWNQPTRPAEK
jgi:hypothetical protein